MDIECCVCDLDGTLLNSTAELSKETISAIRELKESGVTVFHQYNAKVRSSFKVPIKEMTQPDDLPLGKLLKLFIWKISQQQVADFGQDHNQDGMLTIVSSEKNGLDIMAQGVSKGHALEFFAKKHGINLDKTVVFGDNYNDISMMELVGCPIAVGNAENQVKQTAKYVTLCNDEDGVAYAIRKYIFDKS
jgi:Cof subfamily protein (haloacid dehalogenase superfamily)